MKKNILVFALVMALVMSLAACATDANANTGNTNDTTTNDTANNDANTENNDTTNDDANTGDENDDATAGDDTASDDTATGDDNVAGDEPTTDDTATPDEPTTDAPAVTGNPDEMTLPEIMAAIINIETELPMLGEIAPDAESFEFYTFVPAQDGLEAYVSEPMMSSIAHSVVLVRVSGDLDVEEIAQQIEDNHDPRKWCCVEAEKSIVTVNGSTILLVMSAADVADAITANFNALWA